MKYPAFIANRKKLFDNINVVQQIMNGAGIGFCAVTKGFCAAPGITEVYYAAGVRDFADSRIANLKRISYTDVTKWLLRIPMLSEVEDVVKYTDISLNSELETIRSLSEAAVLLNKKHKVVLMAEMGDLREGVMQRDVLATAGEIVKLPGVELHGIGANFNCYGCIIPSAENMENLIRIAREIESAYDIKLPVVSGGNSGSIHLVQRGKMPKGVTNLRLGEVIFIGCETSYSERMPGMHTDVFRLDAQIIELKEKPSLPEGDSGPNAFGEKVMYVDKGLMKRAIIALGRQDVYMDKIVPLDPKIEIIGASSDHMIVDVTNSDIKYNVGDVISFSVSYGSVLSLSTSEYVHKVYES